MLHRNGIYFLKIKCNTVGARVSGGHLCETEALTEAAAETLDRPQPSSERKAADSRVSRLPPRSALPTHRGVHRTPAPLRYYFKFRQITWLLPGGSSRQSRVREKAEAESLALSFHQRSLVPLPLGGRLRLHRQYTRTHTQIVYLFVRL